MMSKASVISVHRLNIVTYKYKQNSKQKFSKTLYAVSSVLIMLTIFLGVIFSDSNLVNDMMSVYSPITSLYSDKNDLSFTSGGVVFSDELNFTLPMLSSDIKIIKGNVIIKCTNTIMINSIEKGVVEEINYTIDGVKYIKIKHSEKVYSIIENVDVVSVQVGGVVDTNKPIALGKMNQDIIVKIYSSDKLCENVTIVGQSIVIG